MHIMYYQGSHYTNTHVTNSISYITNLSQFKLTEYGGDLNESL